MLFNSIPFIIFLLTYIFSIYYLNSYWKIITIIFSIFFYAYWNVYFSILLITQGLFAWFIGYCIQSNLLNKKKYLLIGITLPLLILFVFKYFNFFINDVLKIELQNKILASIILPIGISFYTFQSIMYIVDIYKNKLSNISLINFLVFYLFFPHLIAGPLVRPSSFIPQVSKGIFFNYINFRAASILILWGYFLKLCVSNNLNIYVGNVFNHIAEVNSPTLLVGSFFYSFLIYSDFAGYSLIAIGIAKMIGLNIPANFNNPFNSLNLTEFWRKWHISLSKFLRDYLYIPLGGSRFGLIINCRNILIVMFLGGLWHGASYNFIIWGLLHGILLCLEKINKFYFKIDIKIKFLKKLYVFLLITAIFIPFGVPNFRSLILFIETLNIQDIFEFSQIVEKFYVVRNILLILILFTVETLVDKKNFIFIRNNYLLYGFILTMLLTLIIAFGNFNEISFIYFQF